MRLQQLRKYRIGGIALFDLVFAMIGTILIFMAIHKAHYGNLNGTRFVLAGILLTIPLGIFFHALFGIDTNLNHRIGLSNRP